MPDWAGWRRDRFKAPDTPHIEEPPDWVCEILSPATAAFDRAKKRPAYARAGVRHAWFIDLQAHTLEIFRLENARWVLLSTHGDSELVRAEPFDAIQLELARLWADT